jgi:hypothetical protein
MLQMVFKRTCFEFPIWLHGLIELAWADFGEIYGIVAGT